MLDINRQTMYYALPNGKQPVYEYDSDGYLKYITVNDEQVPIVTGDYEDAFTDPVKFKANISNVLSESLLKEFGVDNSTNFCQIVAAKDELPFTVGTIIWKKSDIEYKDADNEDLDATSADYIVKGVADEGLTFDLFLLQRNVK